MTGEAEGASRGARARIWLLIGVAASAVAAAQPAEAKRVAKAARTNVQSPQGAPQSLPAALDRLARNPADVEALIAAGDGSLAIGDTEAAIGFLTRAGRLAPSDARIKSRLAAALLRNRNPYEALRLYDDAERAGGNAAGFAGDRGLAYDLVGSNELAQRYYRQALATAPSDEIACRLALSQAIARDRNGFETTLLPQLRRNVPAAWRTRIFGLAILGDDNQAVSIANTTLPAALAKDITPYLRYMSRLTRAQQAAAANLGHFPRAAQIGRDDPRLAQYAAGRGYRADAGLIPSGPPLGAASPPPANVPQTGAMSPVAQVAPAARFAQQTAVPAAPSGNAVQAVAVIAAPPVASAPPAQSQAAPAVPAAYAAAPVAPATQAPAAQASAASFSAYAAPVVPAPAQSAAGLPSGNVAAAATGLAPAPGQPMSPASFSPAVAALPAPRVSLPVASPAAPVAPRSASLIPPAASVPASAMMGPPAHELAESQTVRHAPSSSSVSFASGQPSPPTGLDLSTAFRDFHPPEEEGGASVAVDISTIKPARPAPPRPAPVSGGSAMERPDMARLTAGRASDSRGPAKAKATAASEDAPPAKAVKVAAKEGPAAKGKGTPVKAAKSVKLAPPAHPSRIWVQVGTGKAREALAFDWKRMAKAAPEALRGRKPLVAVWGQNNRLLVGPFESQSAAQTFLNGLKTKDIGAFVWTSDAGQAVESLPLA